MAGDWMKIELELPGKPEVFQMAAQLKLSADTVVGKLIKVWGWFDKHTVDGNARGVTIFAIDDIAGVTGFGEAMQSAQWLVQHADSVELPRFDRHNGQTAKNRGLTARRVAKSKAKGNDEGNGAGVSGALPREDKREDKAKATPPAGAADPCPHQEILDAYHRILPELVQMKLWTEDRQRLLRARWREDPKRQTIEWWEQLFEFVRECPHLMGQNDRGWQATLEWIIRPKNFPKVIEGNYK